MLYIKRNELNRVVVTASQNKTISNPYYLFSFQHILSKDTTRSFFKNISTSTERYDEFEFYEGEEPAGYTGDTPYVIFPHEGQYYYSIYECFTQNSTDPQYSFGKVEEGRALVEDDTVAPFFSQYISNNENNANFIYYGEGVNDPYYLLNASFSLYNNQQFVFNWKVDVYPPITITNNYTGKVHKQEVSTNTLNICNYPTSAFTDTFTLDFKTGGTGNIVFTYNSNDLISYDYGWVGSPNYVDNRVISGFTYVSGTTWEYDETITIEPAGITLGPTTKTIDINDSYDIVLGYISGETLCVPPTPTPTPTPSITPTPTTTPNPACPQQIVISDTTSGSVIPNGSYNELIFTGTEYGYFSGGTFFTGTAPDGNNYKVFGIKPSSTYYTYCWDVVNEDWGVGRSNYAYLGQGGTYTGGAWLGASTSVVFGTEYLPGTGSKGLFTTYYLSYPVLCPTPSFTPTLTPEASPTPTPSITPTFTPTTTQTPTPTPAFYALLTENGNTIGTENNDIINTEDLP